MFQPQRFGGEAIRVAGRAVRHALRQEPDGDVFDHPPERRDLVPPEPQDLLPPVDRRSVFGREHGETKRRIRAGNGPFFHLSGAFSVGWGKYRSRSARNSSSSSSSRPISTYNASASPGR